MELTDILGILLGILFLFYVYKCIGIVRENRHYNIHSFGRWSRVISGNRKKRPDPQTGELQLTQHENTRRFFFFLYGIETVNYYDFVWEDEKPVNKLTDDEKKRVVWGDPNGTGMVVVTRIERTNHHRDRWDYKIVIENLETGVPQQWQNNPAVTSPQNIKIKLLFNVTVETVNPNKAANRTGGGTVKWFDSLKSVMWDASGEVVGSGDYSALAKLRGQKMDTKPLASANGASFKEYINSQMLDPNNKDLGMQVCAIDFLDYEVMPESKPYLDALNALAVSAALLEKAGNDAAATRKRLEPIVEKAKEIIKAYEEAAKNIKKEVDVTVVNAATQLTGLKVLGTLTGGASGQNNGQQVTVPDFKTVMDILTAQLAAQEAFT